MRKPVNLHDALASFDANTKPSSPGGAILMFGPIGTSTTGDRHDGTIADHVDSTTGHQLFSTTRGART